MALPAGFDPNRMSFEPSAPVIGIPRNNTSSYSTTSWPGSRRRSLWSRFNEGVADIGNWFSDHVEGAIGVASLIVVAGIAITALIFIIKAWVESGFWMAVLVTVIAAIIGSIGMGLSWYIINIVVNVVMYGLRFIFWNGWTLVIALVLLLASWVVPALSVSTIEPSYTTTETVIPVTRTYRCTANVLNIRSAPNTYSSVIGVLRKGQKAEVYETGNGFARIVHNGQTGYVSLKYMEEI